jgi:6,7-dimethyl-8-ribityllumazine synthase
MNIVEGSFVVPDASRFAIVASRFNHFVVERLTAGAIDGLQRHGIPEDNITLVRVPGAWELPLACDLAARSGKFAAVIALGAIIRGSTAHFEYVASEASKGIAQTMMSTRVPISFGVLTTESLEQAIDRAGAKEGNKGWEAALCALEMVSLAKRWSSEGL